MNEHTLLVLEFDKAAEIVAGFAATDAGRDIVLATVPATVRELVERRLSETREFLEILREGEEPPFGGIPDVRRAVAELAVPGAVLAPIDLLQTATMLAGARKTRRYFEQLGTHAERRFPLLFARAASITPLKDLEDAVLRTLDERAEVKDSASPDLRRIRKNIGRTRDDILHRMSAMLQDTAFQKIIQEPVITIRDDRYVLPLKPGFRQALKGVVHGQSGSRATLFVEPFAVVEQNNLLAELRMDEREEIERILRELTGLFTGKAEAIRTDAAALAELDGIYARSRFGIASNGTVPLITEERRIHLRGARHPLLWKRKASGGIMPNEVELGPAATTLVLSGPNAGGKTVILKTIGLLSLMAQAGMPVTAAEGSELPCFGSVYADIGDEQSIEQEQSTFSSHVGRLAEILRTADAASLVLLDELGSGTDPAEGAGLAAAVLERLMERRAMTVVTTHQTALKLFGSQASGAVNAAMEFDPETLKPTYRLIPGLPGRSYGLEMAARIGVPAAVIERARGLQSRDDARLDALLEQVETESRTLAAEREELRVRIDTLAREGREAAELQARARDEARTIRERARAEARDVLSALRKKLRELSSAPSLARNESKAAAAEVESLGAALAPRPEEERSREPGALPRLHSGDRIRIPRLNRTAVVLTAARGRCEIELGGKRISLAAADLAEIEVLGGRARSSGPGWSAGELAEEASDRIDIRGLRVDEGLAAVEQGINRASVAGLSSVTVIHGLGTGALKQAIQEHLQQHPLVSAMRSGSEAEGGPGVTVAELKD